MSLKLQLLETFGARGSDGATYKVRAYERMTEDPSFNDGQAHWLPTGIVEYRLEDGALVDARGEASMRVVHSGVQLRRSS